MTQIGLLFLAFTILVLLLFTIASVHYVSDVMEEYQGEDEENGHAT